MSRRTLALMMVLVLCSQTALAQEGTAPITQARIDAALARYRGEPSVARVVQAALAQRVLDPARARDAIERARLRGLVPTARAGVRRGQAIDLRGLTGEEGAANISTDDDLMVEGSLVFQFDRLVFASEEAGLLRELHSLESARLELVRAVVALYFERRRLQLERDLLGQRDLARTVRILEIEALLDVFTGGAFTRMMRTRTREQAGEP